MIAVVSVWSVKFCDYFTVDRSEIFSFWLLLHILACSRWYIEVISLPDERVIPLLLWMWLYGLHSTVCIITKP